MIQFFMLKLHLGGCMSPASPLPLPIWIADTARGYGVQNLGLGVQNCTKWVLNYDPVFCVENPFGILHVTTPHPQFELPKTQEGMVYKIVQNEYKIMIQFLMLKLNCGGGATCHQPPHIWIADSAIGNGVQNLWLDIQNCTKWVQNYDPVFYVETAFVGAACHQPHKFELPIEQEGMVYKIWDSVYKIVQNKYKIMLYFSFSKSVFGGPVTCTFVCLYRRLPEISSFQWCRSRLPLRNKGSVTNPGLKWKIAALERILTEQLRNWLWDPGPSPPPTNKKFMWPRFSSSSEFDSLAALLFKS